MVQMELLNSKVNHKDYMCDKTPWGVELVKRIGSPNFKLLYDIYHMQIDEGDVIRTIKDNQQIILVIIIQAAYREEMRLMNRRNYIILQS